MNVPLGLRPLGTKVLIQADPESHAPQAHHSGLFVAETMAAAVTGNDACDSWFSGTVVALGDRVTAAPFALGDRVVFSWASGQEISFDDTKYLIMKSSDILAVVDPPTAEKEP